MPSANILVNDSFKGLRDHIEGRNFWDLPDYNPFHRPLDTMPGLDLPDFISLPLAADFIRSIGALVVSSFGATEKYTGVLSQVEAASYTAQGEEVTEPLVPLLLHFAPNPILVEQFGLGPYKDFREWVTSEEALPSGTLIYTAWTTVEADSGVPSLCFDEDGIPQMDEEGVRDHCPDQRRIRVGDLTTTSRFYASQWGDEGLFFRHDRICPKDQTICEVEESSNPPTGTLGFPEPSFATEPSQLCISDDRMDGTVGVGAPSCPFLSSAVDGRTSCFPGNGDKLAEFQSIQCPMMAERGSPALLLEAANLDPNITPNPGCDLLVSVSMPLVIEPLFFVLASIFRLTSGLFGS